MAKEKYHHGNLKKELLRKGLQHLNKEGYDGFSIRKIAALCKVSPTAFYRHFKSKEDFINAIVMDVTMRFTDVLNNVYFQLSGDSKLKLIEIGKRYVEFMVENPDCFRFIFLTNHNHPIIIQNDIPMLSAGHPFVMVSKCAIDYYSSINMNKKYWAAELISFWSIVQGFTSFIAFNTISYPGGYLEVIQKLLDEKLEKDKLYYEKTD
jgi:AcrR family transcriptional regulator